ncbi:MAG: hypothetical protein H6828_01460 [Planctomycetes bacterium]|nr:hypothetical protein [Planctomycetota bacterium]
MTRKTLALLSLLAAFSGTVAAIADEQCAANSETVLAQRMDACPGYELNWEVTSTPGVDCDPCHQKAYIWVKDLATGNTVLSTSFDLDLACNTGVWLSLPAPCNGQPWVSIKLYCLPCETVE